MDLEPMVVSGLSVLGSAQDLSDQVPDAWVRLEQALEGVELQEPDLRYGVFHMEQFTAGRPTYRYWVTAKLADPDSAPDGFASLDVSGGRYAMLRIHGTRAAIDQAYMALGKWMQEENIKPPAGGVTIEGYDLTRQSVLPPYEEYDYVVFQAIG